MSLGLVSGETFSSGEVVSTEPDWRFIKDYDTVEFQLLEPGSRTTWIIEHEGRIFLPSGYMLARWEKSGSNGRCMRRRTAAPFCG